jgi:hypothetical protein
MKIIYLEEIGSVKPTTYLQLLPCFVFVCLFVRA